MEQIVGVLKQVEIGVPVAELIRKVGIIEQKFYCWKRQSSWSVSEPLPFETVEPVDPAVDSVGFTGAALESLLRQGEGARMPILRMKRLQNAVSQGSRSVSGSRSPTIRENEFVFIPCSRYPFLSKSDFYLDSDKLLPVLWV